MRGYLIGAFSVIVALTACVLCYYATVHDERLLVPLVTSIVYNVVISCLYIYIWKLVKKFSPDSMVQFYLGATGLRLITAMFVCLTYCYLIPEKPQRLCFAIVFCVFYIVMLIFDTRYFIKFERVNRFVK